jgi:hypothetical protein
LICIWRKDSQIGAVSTGTTTHFYEQCVAALTPSSWDVRVEVKSCIALHHLHCAWKYIYILRSKVSIIMRFKFNA